MFYVLAILIIAAALAAVLAPSTRQVLLAIMLGDALVGLLLIVAGAWLLGVIALVVPALVLLGVAVLLRRAGYAALLQDVPGPARGWPIAAAVSVGLGVLLLWTTSTRIGDVGLTSGASDLLTLLHYRTPVSLGVAVALAITAIAGALLIGRVSDDERLLDRAAEQRRLRDERTRRRREHRAAARAARGAGARR